MSFRRLIIDSCLLRWREGTGGDFGDVLREGGASGIGEMRVLLNE